MLVGIERYLLGADGDPPLHSIENLIHGRGRRSPLKFGHSPEWPTLVLEHISAGLLVCKIAIELVMNTLYAHDYRVCGGPHTTHMRIPRRVWWRPAGTSDK